MLYKYNGIKLLTPELQCRPAVVMLAVCGYVRVHLGLSDINLLRVNEKHHEDVCVPDISWLAYILKIPNVLTFFKL